MVIGSVIAILVGLVSCARLASNLDMRSPVQVVVHALSWLESLEGSGVEWIGMFMIMSGTGWDGHLVSENRLSTFCCACSADSVEISGSFLDGILVTLPTGYARVSSAVT